jgi:hypothetical protein
LAELRGQGPENMWKGVALVRILFQRLYLIHLNAVTGLPSRQKYRWGWNRMEKQMYDYYKGFTWSICWTGAIRLVVKARVAIT